MFRDFVSTGTVSISYSAMFFHGGEIAMIPGFFFLLFGLAFLGLYLFVNRGKSQPRFMILFIIFLVFACVGLVFILPGIDEIYTSIKERLGF